MRLEDLVAKKTGQATWRQLFKFLALPEKVTDLPTYNPDPDPNPTLTPTPTPTPPYPYPYPYP